jgi:hypothetical protein
VKTVATAAFGSVIGAWLTSRAQAKRRLIDELKAVRAARALCFSISNKAMTLKGQQMRPMKQRYDEAVTAFQKHHTGLLLLSLDLQEISQLKFPGDVLERIVFEKCAIGEKALAAVVSLSGSIDDLRNAIDFRNGLISEFRKKRSMMSDLERMQLYVGAPQAEQVDNRFAHNMAAMSSQTDDCIFFSMTLSDELLSYSNVLRSRNKMFRSGMSKLLPIDWSIAQQADLIPAESEYAGWLAGFKLRTTKWARFITWIRSWFGLAHYARPAASPVRSELNI